MPPSEIKEERSQRLVRIKEDFKRELAEDRMGNYNEDAKSNPSLRQSVRIR